MVFLYALVGILFGLNAQLSAQAAALKEPQALTHKAIIRTPASTNRTLKVRIKDISKFAGIRDNQLVGYGLVVGLNGTGDTLSSSPYTKESLIGMLERLGVNIRDNSIPSGKNVAAVMVTAKLPPFARTGTTIDIVVSALGDAKDLNGGTLLVTPLMAADGEVYAVGQGEVMVSGISAQGAAASQVTGVPTSAKITNGAIVEKEIAFQLTDLKSQTLSLHSPDLTTAKRTTEAINAHFKHAVATTQDSSSIIVALPKGSSQKIIEAMTQIEQLEIEPDQIAKVIIDPSGVIVLGQKVRISSVALTHGSITVRIAESASVSQPNPFVNVNTTTNNQAAPNPLMPVGALNSPSGGVYSPMESAAMAIATITNNPNLSNVERSAALQLINDTTAQHQQNYLSKTPTMLNAALNSSSPIHTETVAETSLKIDEQKGKFAILDAGADLEELVNALNLLGTSPREMAQILQSIKAAGALHAEVIVS
jgi:flagellar P-ring protein FlgI